jgi:dolichyl-diphosphooligosaccharide--protein glycosyltransferase
MNDDMWNAGLWISNNTDNDTVVISSWVYGHFFSAIAHRTVVFDGRLGYIETMPIRNYEASYTYGNKSPSTAREYWIDKALSTNNETLSMGILRMISSSGDKSFLTMDQYTKNTSKSVEILNNILGVRKEEAYNILTVKYSFKPAEAQNILNYTHPDKHSPAVLVTYNGMIDYGYWIFNFGDWNFDKMSVGNYIYSYGNITQHNSSLSSDDGLQMDTNYNHVIWNNHIPFCVVIVNNTTVKKKYIDSNSDFCVFILLDQNKSVVLDKRFENSTFAKLILQKNNQTSFKALYKNRNVVIWQIN